MRLRDWVVALELAVALLALLFVVVQVGQANDQLREAVKQREQANQIAAATLLLERWSRTIDECAAASTLFDRERAVADMLYAVDELSRGDTSKVALEYSLFRDRLPAPCEPFIQVEPFPLAAPT